MSRKHLAAAGLLLAAVFLCGGCGRALPEGVLAFEMELEGNSDIYLLDLSTGDQRNLTNHPAWDGTPCWSPDGQFIAFASDREGTPDLYIVRADGSDLRRLTEWEVVELMPAWSPDGSRIAFATDRVYQQVMQGGTATVEAGLEIWIVNVDGSDPTRVTGDPQDVAIYPAWSGDGKQILYQNISSRSDIVAMDLLSHIPRNLTETSARSHWTPAWSPGGILIMADEGGENKEIFRMDQTGGNLTNLTNDPAADADPAWSPDGEWVAFVSDRAGTPQIFVMDREGRRVQQVTEGKASHARPVWRPAPAR